MLRDLGHTGEADLLTVANKKPARGQLRTDQLAFNSLHRALHAIGERANTVLKTTFKALRRVSLDPVGPENRVTAVILLIVLTGVLISLPVDSSSSRSAKLFFASWAAYMFAGAFAGLLAAFIQTNASLRGAFDWAAGGAIYRLFVGWILAIVVFASRR